MYLDISGQARKVDLPTSAWVGCPSGDQVADCQQAEHCPRRLGPVVQRVAGVAGRVADGRCIAGQGHRIEERAAERFADRGGVLVDAGEQVRPRGDSVPAGPPDGGGELGQAGSGDPGASSGGQLIEGRNHARADIPRMWARAAPTCRSSGFDLLVRWVIGPAWASEARPPTSGSTVTGTN